MSLPRTLSPLLSGTSRRSLSLASSLKSRYRPSPTSFAPSICASCLRRSLQTATPYRPDTLDLPASIDPAPPRNKDAPDSELTKRNTENKPPPFSTRPVLGHKAAAPAAAEASKPVAKSIPTPTSTSTASPTASSNSRPTAAAAAPSSSTAATTTSAPRKFRPRKAAMTLTPLAVDHLLNLTHQTPPKMIRVGVKHKGCSGLAYHLEYIEKPGKFDEVVEQDGAKVFIDSKALFSIIGSEMDWVEDKLSARFVFKNPNIKEECGCGESFMVHNQAGNS